VLLTDRTGITKGHVILSPTTENLSETLTHPKVKFPTFHTVGNFKLHTHFHYMTETNLLKSDKLAPSLIKNVYEIHRSCS